MQTETQKGTLDRKFIALLAIVLVLFMFVVCYVGLLFLRSRQPIPTTPQILETEIPFPSPVTTLPPSGPITEPIALDIYLPVVVRPASQPTQAAPVTPIVIASTTWRFLSIDANDIAEFENVANPSQTLTARCKDPTRRVPDVGALYTLYDNAVLRAQFESWNFQRFDVIVSK